MTAEEREAAIRDRMPLVRSIARRVSRVVRGADIDELVGDGSIGLIRAVDGFDPSRGSPLDAYARRCIVGAMLNGLRSLDPVSERVRRRMRQAEQRRYDLAHELGSLPTMADLEREDPRLRAARVKALTYVPLSLDGPLPTGESALADYGADPSAIALAASREREIREAIALLPERQQRIVMMHYFAGDSLHAISRRMLVSPQRVSQLHLSALASLRAALAP